jgi:hypothetical protein
MRGDRAVAEIETEQMDVGRAESLQIVRRLFALAANAAFLIG